MDRAGEGTWGYMVGVGLDSLRRAVKGRRASFLVTHLMKRWSKRQEKSASEVATRGVTEGHVLPYLQRRCEARSAPETSLRTGDLGADCFRSDPIQGAKHFQGSRRQNSQVSEWNPLEARIVEKQS